MIKILTDEINIDAHDTPDENSGDIENVNTQNNWREDCIIYKGENGLAIKPIE